MTQTGEKYNWIPSVPYGWKLVKLKYLSSISTGVYDTQDKLEDGAFPFFVRSPHVERIDKYSHDCEAVMTAGDGVGVGKVFHYYNGKFAAHQRVYVFNQFKNNVNGKYIYYSLVSNLKLEVLQGNAKSTVDSLRYPMLSNFPILLPSSSTQNIIVDFLERKTSEIDTLISDKEKLIALLEEKRQAIITEVVTKGLDPDVEMKDSGVEWIGEIPEHWSCYRLKTLITKVQGGTWGKDQQNNENDIPCVRIADFDRTNAKLKETELTVRNLEKQEKFNHLIKQGDLLIEKSGGGEKQPVGYAVIFRGESPTVYTNFIAKLSPNKDLTIPDYLKNIFQVLYFYRLNTKSIKQTTGIQNLDLTSYLNEKVMVPSLKEQEEIKNHIILLNEQTNNLVNTLKETIYKLKEYRQSLIYETVIGKIDVQEMLKETEQEEVSSS